LLPAGRIGGGGKEEKAGRRRKKKKIQGRNTHKPNENSNLKNKCRISM
jgi:hypothetical protein